MLLLVLRITDSNIVNMIQIRRVGLKHAAKFYSVEDDSSVDNEKNHSILGILVRSVGLIRSKSMWKIFCIQKHIR